MKIHLSIVVLALLQLGLPTGVAQSNQGHLRRGDAGEQNPDLESEEIERELRPYGYPTGRARPGQSRKYGLDSLVGFRPYTNSNPVTSGVQQGNIPINQPLTATKSSKASKGGMRTPKRGRRPVPGTIPKRADGSFDGNFVVGVPRTGSLAQALGFYRVEPGSQVVFVQDENDDAIVVANNAAGASTPPPEPTVSPAPTISFAPTRQPTINPTRAPTPLPTLPPTPEPTLSPTRSPTALPTRRPTREPTRRPTRAPTSRPTRPPTRRPTAAPTAAR